MISMFIVFYSNPLSQADEEKGAVPARALYYADFVAVICGQYDKSCTGCLPGA